MAAAAKATKRIHVSSTGLSPVLEAALRFVARGWAVFPLNGKLPFKGSHGHLDATTNPVQVRAWWAAQPKANIGLACSSAHGPLVIDIDGPQGEKAARLLRLPMTREATSGRPHRRHLYFSSPVTGTRIARTLHLRPQLDILGDGGYVVAPPSIHPETGQPYRWLNTLAPLPFPETIVAMLSPNGNSKKTSAPPLPKTLTEGQRDAQLTSLAGSMRRRGASEDAIYAALQEENATRCKPPLPDKQLRKIAHSIAKHAPADEGTPTARMTDLGNAKRFVREHVDELRYSKGWKRPWLYWDTRRWAMDETGEAERCAKLTVSHFHDEAMQVADEKARAAALKHALLSESVGRVNGMLTLAATEPELVCAPNTLDQNPWLLNLHNGTLDLLSGKLLPHRREDLLTKMAHVDFLPGRRAPRWEAFLLEIMHGDAELVEFLQRAVGYSLSGDTSGECLFFCYGTGQNGKTTFLEILRALLGDYAQSADFNTFMVRHSDGPRNDLARMRGARLITGVEAQAEKPFDETIIKQLTGRDSIVARRLYEEFFEFNPTHKIWLAANHKPPVKDHTEAFWRRMKLIPFTVRIPDERKDKGLRASIIDRELPGILNWALAGFRNWQQRELVEPSAVTQATETYREESDVIGAFIHDRCQIDPAAWTSSSAIFAAFTEWYVESQGARARVPSPVWMGRLLGERTDLRFRKAHHERGWAGIALKGAPTC